MNHEADLTPPAPEPEWAGGGASPTPDPIPAAPVSASPSWWSRYRGLLIPVGAGVVVLGLATAAALVLVLRPGSTVAKMVPASVDLYAVVSVDPSVTQKVNLLRTVHRFPETSSDKAITDKLDEALKDTGLSFSGDIQPWLGTEVGVAVRVPEGSNAELPAAFFATSKDDTKARATLAKLRAGTQGKKLQWRDEIYDGVSIAIGSPSSTASKAAAYAMVDHVVVIASSDSLIREIIDTDKGRSARLVDSSDYKATMSTLPSDRFAAAYLNGKSLVAGLKTQITKLASATPLAWGGLNVKSIGDAEALRGIGIVLSARQDGVVLDLAVNYEAAKLSPKTRDALVHAGHPDTVLTWIPKTADGFWAAANLNQTIQSLIEQAGNDASVKRATDEIGLTGPKGVLPHLSGEFALEATVDRSFTPAGALLLATDDAASMRAFLAGLLTLATESSSPRPSPTTSVYQGVTITSLNVPQLSMQGRFVPSYAVVDGMGILASTPAELRVIIDAHRTRSNIAGEATYAAATRASLSRPAGIFYVDLGRLVKALEAAPSGGLGKPLDSKARANLAPLKAFIMSADSNADRTIERVVVLVQ
jgi:uncharacterized protein DUF3352